MPVPDRECTVASEAVEEFPIFVIVNVAALGSYLYSKASKLNQLGQVRVYVLAIFVEDIGIEFFGCHGGSITSDRVRHESQRGLQTPGSI